MESTNVVNIDHQLATNHPAWIARAIRVQAAGHQFGESTYMHHIIRVPSRLFSPAPRGCLA